MNVMQRADALGTFRYVEVWLMETAAAWTPLTPEMEAKVMFGRHIWDFAQHADWLGKRTFELRQPEHYTRPPRGDYLDILRSVREAAATPARLSLLYDVAVAGLVSRYETYLAATDRLLDGPSALVVERILPELRRQREDARRLRAEVGIAEADTAEWRRREAAAAAWTA